MTYESTFFGKQSFAVCFGNAQDNRTYWLHTHLLVYAGMKDTCRKNADGSISVLDNVFHEFRMKSWGMNDKGGLQKSLARHAEKIAAAGATILTQSKNKLVAIHNNIQCENCTFADEYGRACKHGTGEQRQLPQPQTENTRATETTTKSKRL